MEIRNERRIELAYEGLRYYDIRRWNNPNEDMPTVRVETGMWIEKIRITHILISALELVIHTILLVVNGQEQVGIKAVIRRNIYFIL